MPPGFVRERVHFDRAVTPLFATTILPAIERGYRLASLAGGGASGAITSKVIGGYVYTAWEPLDAPPVETREIPDLVDAWEKERIPEMRHVLAELQALAAPTASERRVAGELAQLPAKLERVYALHYETAFVARTGAAMLEDSLRGREEPDADLAVATLLAPTDSLLTDIEAWLAGGASSGSPVWDDARLRPARLDLDAPTWGEDESLAHRAAAASDERAWREGHERALARRAQMEARVMERFPEGAHDSVRFVLDALRRARGLAQTLNFLAGEAAVGATRAVFLRTGARLGIGGDVVWLTFDEVIDALASGSVARGLVDERKRAHERALAMTPPDTIGDTDAMLADPRIASMLGVQTQGRGASPGIAEGPARALVSEDDLADVREGDILIVRVLEPSWTPAMQKAAGIIAELGGVLSHAAVVAREMGKPAVVGAAGAMKQYPTGKRLRIDGTTGENTRL